MLLIKGQNVGFCATRRNMWMIRALLRRAAFYFFIFLFSSIFSIHTPQTQLNSPEFEPEEGGPLLYRPFFLPGQSIRPAGQPNQPLSE